MLFADHRGNHYRMDQVNHSQPLQGNYVKLVQKVIILLYRSAAMIEPPRAEHCVPICVNVTCVTSTRKKPHVTRVSADIPIS